MSENTFGNLTLSFIKNENNSILKWIGESSDLYPSEHLTPFFDNLISSIEGSLIIQFQELSFMNSSTIHPLILLIKSLDDKNIKTEIQFNKNSTWQRTCFKSMEGLTKVLNNITISAV